MPNVLSSGRPGTSGPGLARRGRAWQVAARQSRKGGSRIGQVGRVQVRQRRQGEARPGVAGSGSARLGKAWQSGDGAAGSGSSGRGRQGLGMARRRAVRHGGAGMKTIERTT